ncbi:ROK family protein [Phytoactinopolyspora limicola]|uniref:ROK family protein n=1 Tax=Phytoactinopolyspora limicola TaxID=2715536 RepID=UPI001A9C590D|nr:ROK family protein [Phytoactinopolyspora limicola]
MAIPDQLEPTISQPSTGTVLALDVGGTRLKGAVLDAAGRSLADLTQATGADAGPDEVVRRILHTLVALRDLPEARDVGAAGLALPGLVDPVDGRAVWSENIRWRDVPFQTLAEERLGLPVTVGHDVRACGLAEAQVGAARGQKNVLVVPIGTGIAATIITDGHVVDGRGLAGELGHLDVGYDEPCACGGTGCAEAVSSAAAIARRYSRRSGVNVEGAAEVLERKRDGDTVAVDVWAQAVDGLARAFAAATTLVAPDMIVIGGGLALAGPDLFDPVEHQLRDRLTFQRMPTLVPAALGDRAGCIGAGILARQRIEAGGRR